MITAPETSGPPSATVPGSSGRQNGKSLGGRLLDWFQEGLGWVGMIVPAVSAIPDLLNAGIHTLRGNYTDAAMAGFFAIPIVGDAAAAGNKLKKGADKVGDVLHSVDNAVDSAQAAENAASAGKNAAKNADVVDSAVVKKYTEDGIIIRNAHLAGKKHPDTGVPFDKDGFPVFESRKDV